MLKIWVALIAAIMVFVDSLLFRGATLFFEIEVLKGQTDMSGWLGELVCARRCMKGRRLVLLFWKFGFRIFKRWNGTGTCSSLAELTNIR